MIYWISGTLPIHKQAVGIKLTEFLKTEKRNWRKSTFHITDVSLSKVTDTNNYNSAAQTIAHFISNADSDVVVSIGDDAIIPDADSIVEIKLTKSHPSVIPTATIEVDTSYKTIKNIFTLIQCKLKVLNLL